MIARVERSSAPPDPEAKADPRAKIDPREDDVELVKRFRAGEHSASKAAFEELVRRYQRPIFYLALRYVKVDEDARDIAQRAFVRVFQKIGEFRGDAAFRTWLYRIAVNLALNHVRDHAREQPLIFAGIDSDSLSAEPIGAGRLLHEEAGRKLRAAVAELPPKQRLVLELRVFEELSFRETAEIAECSENAAKVNFHHAVKRLRELMREP